ncbi:MAG TPA: TM1802 family CRISPR-associated protein [Chitinophagaceae bacterium]
MLSTLIKLGEQLSDGRGEWDDIIDFPNTSKEREKDIKCYVAELVFDLDLNTVYVAAELKKEYEEKDCLKFKNIKIQGGNNKAIYCCVESGKTEQIRKTFFGTIDGKGKLPIQGQFQELIKKDYPQFSDTSLFALLPKIFTLKTTFEVNFTVVKETKGKNELVIDEKLLFESLSLSFPSKVVLIFTSVICSSLGINNATPIADIEGYDTFIKAKFLDKKQNTLKSNNSKRVCYATGKLLEDVSVVEFADRYSLNKMFVKETKNFVSGFDKNNFGINYQVNIENQLYLSRASKYLLEHGKIRIAGIDHCIIPQFLQRTNIDLKYLLSGILKKTDLLFQTEEFDEMVTAIEYETEEPYWITYLAFESDGNFFKTINEIKDVSKTHFYKLIDKVRGIDNYFRNDLSYAVDWQSVMISYGKPIKFNLSTIYSIIPVRKDKEKKNEVLAIFKMIFENRKIEPNKIYKHFCDLILCHRYKRYEAFKNIKKYDDQYFDFAIRDSVFKYLALVTFLKQLNLLNDMEQNETTLLPTEILPNEYGQRIDLFFKQMDYNSDQKAMFYLGRMLNAVAYLQKDKNKTVLEKVNFSGMDKSDILRLRNSLIEKAQQYNKVDKVLFPDANFSEFFNFNTWTMKPEESVFFLLSGYSFGLIKNQTNPQ